VSGRSPEEFSDAVTTLERANLLRVTTDSLGFIHDLVRETVEMTLPSIRRTLLHLRAARATREPVLSARHYWGGVNAWDDEDILPAVNSFLAFAAQTATRGDLNLGLTWFDRAHEHANQDDLRVRALLERANALVIHGKHLEALATLDRADLHLEILDDAVLKARSLVTRALLQNRELRRPDLAKVNLQQALQILEGLKGTLALGIRSDALTLSAAISHSEARNAEALKQGIQALQIARTLQDSQRQASALAALGLSAIALKDEHAEAYLLESLEIREHVGDLLGMGRALNNLSLHYAAQDLPDEAIRTLERALALQKRLGNSMDEAITLANVGAIYFDSGRYEQAKLSYQASVDSLETQGLQAREDVIFNLAEVEYKLGFFDQALPRLASLIEITKEPYMCAAARVMSAEIALERGDEKLAIQQAKTAFEQARTNNWADLETSSANLLAKLESLSKPL
jgi:tetratricopeptide (TPR) repeat protein